MCGMELLLLPSRHSSQVRKRFEDQEGVAGHMWGVTGAGVGLVRICGGVARQSF